MLTSAGDHVATVRVSDWHLSPGMFFGLQSLLKALWKPVNRRLWLFLGCQSSNGLWNCACPCLIRWSSDPLIAGH